MVYPPEDGAHPSTNRARRGLTSFMRRTPANHYATPSTVTCHGQSLQRQTGVVPRVAPCRACCCSLYVLHAWSPSYLIAISRATVVPSSSSRARPQLHHSLTHSDRGRGRGGGSVHPSSAAAAASCVCVCVCVSSGVCRVVALLQCMALDCTD